MFTGIIETLGEVISIEKDQCNLHFTLRSAISHELKIDQSVSHNGVCLTVVEQAGDTHRATAIAETLEKSNLGNVVVGNLINLERCTKVGGRLDGHIVQGHVDQTAICVDKKEQGGSWIFTFSYDPAPGHVTVEKGSVTVNGISLTVVNSHENRFSVAIIPYTIEHTNLKEVEVGSVVNLEFDIIGKYVARLLAPRVGGGR